MRTQTAQEGNQLMHEIHYHVYEASVSMITESLKQEILISALLNFDNDVRTICSPIKLLV